MPGASGSASPAIEGRGRCLGAQIVGDHRGQVAKRIDFFAAALYAGLNVAYLPAMDLSYTPPFGEPWDAI